MDIAAAVILFAEIIGALGVIWAAFVWIVSPIRRFFRNIDTIFKELTPNEGNSIKDAVVQLRDAVNRIERRQRAWLTVHSEAVFETDSAGEIVWINRAYLHLLGATEGEVLGRGWRNYLCDDSTFGNWTRAVADKRDFRECFSVRDSNGRQFSVRVEAFAMRDEKGELAGYVGNVARK